MKKFLSFALVFVLMIGAFAPGVIGVLADEADDSDSYEYTRTDIISSDRSDFDDVLTYDDPDLVSVKTEGEAGGSEASGEQQPDGQTPTPVPTGDIAFALSAIALVAVAGAVIVARRRRIED